MWWTIAVCSLLVVAAGQPPGVQKIEVDVYTKPVALNAKPDDLQVALAGHPDVQIAEAKVRLAQAELAKAKLLAAQQAAAAQAKVVAARPPVTAAEESLKVDKASIEQAQKDLDRVRKLAEGGTATAAKVQTAAEVVTRRREGMALTEQKLATAKAALAAAEAELRAMTGGGPAAAPGKPAERLPELLIDGTAGTFDILRTPFRAKDIADPSVPASPLADKLRAALEAPVALDLPADAKLAAVSDALSAALAPSGLTLRTPAVGPADEVVTAGSPLKGQRPLGQWLEVVADTFSGRSVPVTLTEVSSGRGGPQRSVSYVDIGRREFFVRDYGLLFTDARRAPAGALTTGEFVRRAAAERPKPADAANPLSAEVLRKVRELLGKRVKLPSAEATPQARLEALAAAAGTDLTIQAPILADNPAAGMSGGERTVAAWLDLFRDQWVRGYGNPEQLQFFVREYGLILCYTSEAPPGAVPLAQVK